MIGWLAAATVVGVRLERSVDVPPERAREIVAAIADAIDARDDLRAVIDDPVWACEDDASCAEEVRTRTGSEVVVLLELFGAITEMRIAAHVQGGGAETDRAELDVPIDRWRPSIGGLVDRLFPRDPPPAPAPTPVAETEIKVAPIVLFSLGAGCLAAGVGLGIESRSARHASQVPNLDPMEFDRLADRTVEFAIAANVTYALAGAAALVGLLLYLFAP